MKKEKLGSEPAFPMVNQEGLPGIISVVCDKVSGRPVTVGMSKRFYAACAAMQGILSNPTNGIMLENRGVVRQSYLLADELLTQENE